jgi:tellurite resistance protein TerC
MPWWAWAGFLAFIVAMLALDLGLLNRSAKAITVKKALAWCGVWAALALGFAGLLAAKVGPQSSLAFLAGYLVELCLSVDNVFVFIVVFQFFRVEPRYQHRVLFWGIVGALFMRAIFIFAGVGLIHAFHWIIYVFGAFLVYTGIKFARPRKEEGVAPEKNPAVRIARRFLPVTPDFVGGKLFVRADGRLNATPLLIVLLVIETTDVMFALDSIPAVIAITRNEFIVFTSNIFAILGLRSLYFAVSGVMQLFRFLNYGLALVLVFVGAKMLGSAWFDLPVAWSLAVIGLVLGSSIALSILVPAPKK